MIELPRLTAPELAASAVIFRQRPPLQLETAAGPLTLEPVLDAGEPAGSWRLDVRLGEGRVELQAEAALAETLLGPALPGIELGGLEPELRTLVNELLLGPLLIAAEAALGRQVRVLGEAATVELPYRLDFLAGLGGGSWPLRLRLDLRGLEVVTRAIERMPTVPAAMDELVLPLAVEAGRTRLGPDDLERAAMGDLLLLETAPVAGGRLDLVLGGMLAFVCRLEEAGLVYAGEVRRLLADNGNAALQGLDEAPLELVFELGRLAVSLGELRSLSAGHVFDLGRDLRHPVDVVLAGRKIGEGELVQVGERVGVRLRSLIPR